MSVQTPPAEPLAAAFRHVSKRYRGGAQVGPLDMTAAAGQVTALVGPNGSGKTTALRMLLGLARWDDGEVRLWDRPLQHNPDLLRRVGALVETPASYPSMSGMRNLRVLARLAGLPAARCDEVLEIVGLSRSADQRVSAYSLGMRQRLGLAAALLPDPDLLVLDEPANGLDPQGVAELRGLLRRLADSGTAVVVSSHVLAEVAQVCDHLVALRSGEVVYAGPVWGLLAGRGELRAVPEDPDDLMGLVAALGNRGHEARTADGAAVLVPSPGVAAAVNALAFSCGIVLRELHETTPSIEDAFFALTGRPGESGDRFGTGRMPGRVRA